MSLVLHTDLVLKDGMIKRLVSHTSWIFYSTHPCLFYFLHNYRYFLNGLTSHAQSREKVLDEGLSYTWTTVPATTTVQNYVIFSWRPTLNYAIFHPARSILFSPLTLSSSQKSRTNGTDCGRLRRCAWSKKATGQIPCVKTGLGRESWRTQANASSWNSPPQPYARWTGCATVAAWHTLVSLWFAVARHLMSVVDGTNHNWRRYCNKLLANIASTTMALPFQLGFESCIQIHYYILRCFGYYESALILAFKISAVHFLCHCPTQLYFVHYWFLWFMRFEYIIAG